MSTRTSSRSSESASALCRRRGARAQRRLGRPGPGGGNGSKRARCQRAEAPGRDQKTQRFVKWGLVRRRGSRDSCLLARKLPPQRQRLLEQPYRLRPRLPRPCARAPQRQRVSNGSERGVASDRQDNQASE